MVTAGPSVAPPITDWGDGLADYVDLIAALIVRPSERAWESVRAAWLFQMADALALNGYIADAEAAREHAMGLVRAAISAVAEGGHESESSDHGLVDQ